MQTSIHIHDDARGRCSIDIEGTIGLQEAAQFENPGRRVATYERFRDVVRCVGAIEADEVVVNIRSTGGDVNDALLIYEALRSLRARIVTRCYGYTASAATVIAQAASPGGRQVASSALYLIHNSSCAVEGNAAELASRTGLLQQTDARLAELYAERSGRPVSEFADLMALNGGCGRWLSPEEAVAAGLADCVVEAPADGVSVQNRARGWRGLLARLGLQRRVLPADRNIFHLDALPEQSGAASPEPAPELSPLAQEEGQRGVQPTRTQAVEDPSPYEAARTSNGAAYEADARCIRRG